jgi:hypothetical protein
VQKIPLIQAKAGMILARDVFRGDPATGMPICGKATKLTDSLISRLEKMDIQSIHVSGHPLCEEGEPSCEKLLRELDDRFGKTFQEPLNVIIHDVYKAYLIKSMGDISDRQAE